KIISSESLHLLSFRYQPNEWSEERLKADLLKITRDDLFEHYRRYYVPENALLVVVGPFSPKKILPKIQEYFGLLAKSDRPADPTIAEPPQSGERRVEVRIRSEA